MEEVIISREEYKDLLKKSRLFNMLKNLDPDFIRQVLSSKEDLKHGRFKILA